MLAIVFPGQGSQTVGMATDFVRESSAAQRVFEEADEATGVPLSRWIAEGPEEVLQRTEVTQPAVLTASIAIYRAIEEALPVAPAFFAGHSLGEYSALVAAGALELGDAVRLVQHRGQLMQEAIPEGQGAMTAVTGMPADEIARICAEIEGIVAPANLNSPVQTVIAGEREAVEAAAVALKEAGAKRLVPLAVSAPFHCELMRPAMEKLAPRLTETPFSPARVPVVSNVTSGPYTEPAEARERLREQVCAPVRWVETIHRLIAEGATLQLEVGPGKVLTGLAAKIDRNLARACIGAVDDVDDAMARISEVVA